ncbi:methyltransferase [Cohnella abietis]|uniref:Methyltransferase n=1 Tax=Cohnella abietis TaxID=2507935 RepID=A0A3T1DCY5_9BACL|nr:methyltransferase [Cohnella abietis]
MKEDIGLQEQQEPHYIYVIVANDNERSLCDLEMRSLFGNQVNRSSNLLHSMIRIEPNRSPFIKQRLEVLFEGANLEEIANQVGSLELNGATFKVEAMDNDNPEEDAKLEYDQKRMLEREIGWRIRGKAEMRKPDKVFGFVQIAGRWLFGELIKGEAIWLKHNEKPRKYSTALSTRVARAVANIAVPHIKGLRVIDPCCGIGTVLVEALSMGIDIVGRELNPLAATGARANLAYFGFESEVILGDMRQITEHYDVAIIDMPYNLCSVLPMDEKLEMLQSLRSFADRAVVVTIEKIDSLIEEAGFRIKDRCTVSKGNFTRYVLVCE